MHPAPLKVQTTTSYDRQKLEKFMILISQLSPASNSEAIEIVSRQVIAVNMTTITEVDFMVLRIRERAINSADQSSQCVELGIRIYTKLNDTLRSAFSMAMTMKALNAMYESVGVPPITGTTRFGPQNAQAAAMFYGNMFNHGIVLPSDLFKTITIFMELGRSGEVARFILQTIRPRIIERMTTEDPPNPFIKRLYEMITEEHLDTLDTHRKLQHVRGPEAVFNKRKTGECDAEFAVVHFTPLELLNKSNITRVLMKESEAEIAKSGKKSKTPTIKTKAVPKPTVFAPLPLPIQEAPRSPPKTLKPRLMTFEPMERPLAYRSDGKYPSMVQTKPRKQPEYISNEFEKFLASISTETQLTFNLERFKTCSDYVRRTCARLLIEAALAQPTKIEAYAKVAERVLITHHTTRVPNEKTFIGHLQDACDEQMEMFNREHKVWMQIASFGLFLAHMYVLEVQKLYLMNMWLDRTKTLAAENDLALNMWFKAVKIIHRKMNFKDDRMHGVCMEAMRKFRSEKRVPKIYHAWLDELFGEQREMALLPKKDQQMIRGLMGFDGTAETAAEIIKQSGEIHVLLSLYLENIQNKKEAIPPLSRIRSAFQVPINMAAKTFIKHAVKFSDKAGIYVNILQSILLPCFTDDMRYNWFVCGMNEGLHEQMRKHLDEIEPGISDWTAVRRVSVLLCEMFNHGAVDPSVVKSWLDKLQVLGQRRSKRCVDEYNYFVTNICDSLGDENLGIMMEEEEEEALEDAKKEEKNVENEDEGAVGGAVDTEDEEESEISEESEVSTPEADNTKEENEKTDDESSSEELEDFDFDFTKLKQLKQANFMSEIDGIRIKSTEQTERLAKSFFEVMKEDPENHFGYAEIAKIIILRQLQDFEFKKFLNALLIKAYDEASAETAPESLQRIAKFIVSFYRVEVIDSGEILRLLDKLSVDDFKSANSLDVFYELLKNVGMKLVADGVDLKALQQKLEQKLEKTEEVMARFRIKEVIDYARDLQKLATGVKTKKGDWEAILKMLKSLNQGNMKEIASQIKEMEFSSFDEVAEIFVAISLDAYESGHLFAKLLREIGEFECDSSDRIKRNLRKSILEKFEREFSDLVANSSAEENSTNKTKMLSILWLISSCHSHGLTTSIDLCFYLTALRQLKAKHANIDLDIVGMLIATTESKIDGAILAKFLEDINHKQLMAASGASDESFTEFVDIFESASLADEIKAKILRDEKTMRKFAEVSFIYSQMKTKFSPKPVEFCKVLSQNPKFSRVLSNYAETHGLWVLVYVDNATFTPSIFRNKVLLASELYSSKLITFKSLRPWLSTVLTSQFTYEELHEITSALKANESEDTEVKIHHLDAVLNEKMLSMCLEIKEELREVKDLVGAMAKRESLAIENDLD